MGAKIKLLFIFFGIAPIFFANAQVQYFRNNLQFNLFGNISGFHIKEVWGTSMALQNVDLLPKKVAKILQPMPLKSCRETCFVQKSCSIVTWAKANQTCKLGSATSLFAVNTTYSSTDVWLFFKQGYISLFIPAVEGISYFKSGSNGTFDLSISSPLICNSTLRRLAYPNSADQLASIIGYSYTVGTMFLRLNLIGLSDGVTLQWGDGSQFNFGTAPFPVVWDSFILAPTFVILKGNATAVESTDVYYSLCMDNTLFMMQPWY